MVWKAANQLKGHRHSEHCFGGLPYSKIKIMIRLKISPKNNKINVLQGKKLIRLEVYNVLLFFKTDIINLNSKLQI